MFWSELEIDAPDGPIRLSTSGRLAALGKPGGSRRPITRAKPLDKTVRQWVGGMARQSGMIRPAVDAEGGVRHRTTKPHLLLLLLRVGAECSVSLARRAEGRVGRSGVYRAGTPVLTAVGHPVRNEGLFDGICQPHVAPGHQKSKLRRKGHTLPRG